MQPNVDCALLSLMLAACTVLALDTFVVCGLGANSSDCTSSSVCSLPPSPQTHLRVALLVPLGKQLHSLACCLGTPPTAMRRSLGGEICVLFAVQLVM